MQRHFAYVVVPARTATSVPHFPLRRDYRMNVQTFIKDMQKIWDV